MALTLKDLKRFYPEKKTTRLLLSTLLLTVGVYLAFPERETVATLPLLFVFSVLAYLAKPSLLFQVGAGFAIALFYGKMGNLPVFIPFALFSAASALCGALAVIAGKKLLQKKYAYLALCIPVLAAGLLMPLLFTGTPSARASAEETVAAYLKEKYPDQVFSDLVVYYDCQEEGYSVSAFYDFRGNTLLSSLFLSEGEIEDGFLDDFCGWMQEERKSELIAILKEGEEAIQTDSEEVTGNSDEMVFHGSYGSIREEMYPLMNFSVTFREEKPDMESFSAACREAVTLLRGEDFSYGTVTFYGLDAGRVSLVCKVTPETMPEDVSGLIRYQK